MANTNDCTQNTDPLKLKRDGTAQSNRIAVPLNTAYARVDGLSAARRMLIASALSEYLIYYSSDNIAAGDWSSFFEDDLSFRLAMASVQDVEAWSASLKSSLRFLNNLDNESANQTLVTNLSEIFSIAGSLALELEKLRSGLLANRGGVPEWLRLHEDLKNLIRTQLADSLHKLIAWYKAGKAAGYLSNIAAGSDVSIMGHAAKSFQNIIGDHFPDEWQINTPLSWASYVANITPDASIYGSGSGTFAHINHIATHSLFNGVLDQFLRAWSRVASESARFLELSFTNFNRHEPHYALFLSFLRLYEHIRAETNTITARHLDFYYRDVLRFKEKPAVPSSAHLIATLAKQATAYEFKKDTLFIAGKDSEGKTVYFGNSQSVVAGKAKVERISKMYLHNNEPLEGSIAPLIHQGRIFAESDAINPASGEKKDAFQPFFSKTYRDGSLTSIDMPFAQTGFCVASHHLTMAGGERTIQLLLTFEGTPALPANDLSQNLVCELTTEKGWLEITAKSAVAEGTNQIRVVIDIGGEQPAIVPGNQKTHGSIAESGMPLLRILLKQSDDTPYLYSDLKELVLQNLNITVSVNGLRTLNISNDFGPVDSSKPFQPFGARPSAGTACIIGSNEVFRKKLSSLRVNINWPETPAAFGGSLPQVMMDYFWAGEWQVSGEASKSLSESTFTLTAKAGEATSNNTAPGKNEPFTTASRDGFVRLRLGGGLGYTAYQTALLSYLRKDSGASDPGAPPVGPTASQISIDYISQQQISFVSPLNEASHELPLQFYHLHPFGFAKQQASDQAGTIPLLPRFEFERDHITKQAVACCFIGLSDLKAGSQLNLLFQVADGTANPLTLKPRQHLHWSYLSDNRWKAFNTTDIVDETDGLLNPGIVSLFIPNDITATETLFAGNYYWIRIAVSEGTDAVCQIRQVAAQAMLATYTSQVRDAGAAPGILKAGSISKSQLPDAAVKKIEQPFDSFGGSAAESPESFYTRISERLRHKNRSITLWDFEHMILEEFPEIYRARCLNHTRYEPDSSGSGIYRELAAGHVTIITIPDKTSHVQRDPLRPYTSLGTLQRIENYLKNHSSCFARLHVCNPVFEEIRICFKVRFYDGFDEAYYTRQLQESITRMLSPWAYSDNAYPDFGGIIRKSAIIDFIEEHPYVDYITDVEMYHETGGVTSATGVNEATGSTAISILVSAAAHKHGITVIHPAEQTNAANPCNCGS